MLKNYFIHPRSKQILSKAIIIYISYPYFAGMDMFYEKTIKPQSPEQTKIIISEIEKYTEDVKKVILIEKVLRIIST